VDAIDQAWQFPASSPVLARLLFPQHDVSVLLTVLKPLSLIMLFLLYFSLLVRLPLYADTLITSSFFPKRLTMPRQTVPGPTS
jgi:hypothetical protein